MLFQIFFTGKGTYAMMVDEMQYRLDAKLAPLICQSKIEDESSFKKNI